MSNSEYTSKFLINIGEALTDSSLYYRLYDSLGVATGVQFPVTGLVDFGDNYYLFTLIVERSHVGVIKFYKTTDLSTVVAVNLVYQENIPTPTRLAPD